jgi:hypothetical protein
VKIVAVPLHFALAGDDRNDLSLPGTDVTFLLQAVQPGHEVL